MVTHALVTLHSRSCKWPSKLLGSLRQTRAESFLWSAIVTIFEVNRCVLISPREKVMQQCVMSLFFSYIMRWLRVCVSINYLSYCCDENTWRKQLKEGFIHLLFLAQFEDKAHRGGEVWWQEQEAAGHVAFTVRKQRAMDAMLGHLSLFHSELQHI